jgi:Eukaryotic aspartyl protease
MQIQIGTSNKQFTMMLDTQTAGIWVAADNCTTGGCVGMSTKLGSQDSTTLEPSPLQTWDLNYPMNGSVGGRVDQDTITIAGIPSKRIYFGVADTVSSRFNGNVRPLSCKLT